MQCKVQRTGAVDRPSAHRRGYDARWRKESRAFLVSVDHRCVSLGGGCTLIATLVDHIKPHRGDMILFWDRSNWQPLCDHCHNVHKARLEAAVYNPVRDHRGRLLR